jgi:putative transposase
LKRLRRLSRVHSRRQKGSENRKKLSLRLSKLHWRIKCQRHDWIHKLTTRICRENQSVVIEDLSVKNMMANHKLARAISDEGWYEFRRQLNYKSQIYGIDVVVAPKFYPSSKTCSNCGHVKATLSLAERTYTCSECGFSLDRDLNAARNLSRLGLSRNYACGHCVSPAGTEAVVVEAGTNSCTLVYTN